jgi:hypothetical protein
VEKNELLRKPQNHRGKDETDGIKRNYKDSKLKPKNDGPIKVKSSPVTLRRFWQKNPKELEQKKNEKQSQDQQCQSEPL